MDTVKEMLFKLLRGGLKREAVTIVEPFPFDDVVQEASRHGVENLLFYGLQKAGFTIQDPKMKALFHTVGENIFRSENQVDTAMQVCKAFEENGIAYMPLKGLLLRDLYPAPEMRTMGDVDILIRPEQHERIRALMPTLGFSFVLESAHECSWGKPGILYMELHKAYFRSII